MDGAHYRVTPTTGDDGQVLCTVTFNPGPTGGPLEQLGDGLSIDDALDLLDDKLQPWGRP